jgi:uncharacterized protein (TIGR00268 family)
MYSVERGLSSSAKHNGVTVTHTPGAAAPTHFINDDAENATALVDGLIEYTRQLMKNSQNHIVAYSGGVDSSLVAALLQQASHDQHNVLAVLGISPAVSQEQIQQAREVASFLNLQLRQVYTTEGSDKMYIENKGKACLACKTHLYESLQAVYRVSAESRPNSTLLYNGTNADDLQDSTRVGLIAAHEFGVISPLHRITKQQVRIAARHLNLPNWNAAAAPCLRSRLALGVQATQHHLSMIEEAERFVRTALLQEKLHAASNMRVRMLTNQRAMIEVDEELLSEFSLDTVEQEYFQSLGFSSVSARPFRTGSVAKRWEERAASSDDSDSMSMEGADSNRMVTVAAVG